MDSGASRTMEVAALGRPFGLGMLYDCRQDSLIQGMTLWDFDDLKDHIKERPQNYNDFEIVASESIADKTSALNIEASLKASFFSGLVEVGGSAKYLNDTKTSKNQARVTLKYKATTKVKELSMDHLGRDHVKHPYVFDKGLATHVVTAILYGAQAFFVFDRDVSENENHQDIHGMLKVIIKKIPSITIEGEGSLKMEDKHKEHVDTFSCRFFGDFSLQKSPTTFQDAVEVYQSLPKLLGANGENVVPMKVWLLPLTIIDSSAAKLVHQISARLVQESQRVLEDFSELEIRYNDALRTTIAQQFPQIGDKIKQVKEMCFEFKLGFQQTLANKLPSIRGGGEEEDGLAEILKKRHSSPFNSKNLNEWMDCKEREIDTLMSFTNMMKNTKIVPSQTDLYTESFSADHAVCFVFNSLGRDEPYLSALSNYLKQTPDNPQDAHTQDVEKDQWYASREVAEVMHKAKLFSDFAEANKENKKIKFLTVGSTNETQKGSSIYLYKEGFSVNENFEPPSKPETVTISDINLNSVTLKVSPPRFGAEDITSYSVEYCVSGEDEWKQKKASKAEEVTVSNLSPNTEYMFRCRAVTSVGVGPAKFSGSTKTLPCSPPGKPRVEANSREISVSWEKPAELGQDVHILSYIVEYAKTDNGMKEEELQWNEMMAGAEKAIISELQSDTEYVVRVKCDCGEAGRSKESITVNVRTTKLTESLRSTSKRMNSESPSVYKLTLTEEDMNISGCRRFSFGNESTRQNHTIMLFGVTRSGKSTLINAMINYIVGVKWKDNFRFKLLDEDQFRSQAESQTSEVTVYKINHQDGFKINYSLTIVDTPGFGDTGDIERDEEIIEHLRNLFSAECFSEIDAVCFVAQATLTQLTPSQKCLFDYLLSIFGKDVAENIRVLVTSADGQQPPVLKAITASGVPCPKTKDGLPVHFKFNNSMLFADNKSSAADSMSEHDDDDGGFDQMFWNMGTKGMQRFFVALNVIDTKSLTMTKDILRERKQLEKSHEDLQKQVKSGLAKLEEIRGTIGILRKHKAESSRNENFVFEFTVRKPVKVFISGSYKYRWEYWEVKEKITIIELKKKYQKATKTPVKVLIDELDNKEVAIKSVVSADHQPLTLSTTDVCVALSRINACKAAGPDGIPRRVLWACAVQLTEVWTDIFNLSLAQAAVPACFKTTSIVPVPKHSTATSLNDFRPVALTPIIMKCFKRLVLAHLKTCLAVSWEKPAGLGQDVHILSYIVEYAKTDNGMKEEDLQWNEMMAGAEKAIISELQSETEYVVRGCVLSPLLYFPFTYDCTPVHGSNTIVKFADDTTVIGLISNNDETAYREEVQHLSLWCTYNNLALNTKKTKELIVDFKKSKAGTHTPILINGTEVERVTSFRFLGVHISEDLSWTLNTSTLIKKAHQCLFFLRRLKKVHLSPQILVNFYRCTIESILTNCVTVWYGNCSALDRKALQRVVKTAQRINGSSLPSIETIQGKRCLCKARSIIKDCSHPNHSLFTPLPSRRRLRSLHTRTSRFRGSFFPAAVTLLNSCSASR
ncbi:uncharacterized protein LOC116052744 [Sander lucioperca]|uniref:uncharacterized protein LOC116052744 n=1 Tax=Sander lucioperca TaxID=283035 RepID=UPI00165361F4|nr:uncharacterized protein LOC116052744 [Sander lucioperca]